MATDNDERAARLKEARKAAGFRSARAAAKRFGWVYESYAQHENGTRGIDRVSDEYARAYKISEAWLLTGTGAGPDKDAAREINEFLSIVGGMSRERRSRVLEVAREQAVLDRLDREQTAAKNGGERGK